METQKAKNLQFADCGFSECIYPCHSLFFSAAYVQRCMLAGKCIATSKNDRQIRKVKVQHAKCVVQNSARSSRWLLGKADTQRLA